MHIRRYLTLLLPLLLLPAALAVSAGVGAAPAAAGGATGYVTDQYDNPLGGILVEALDAVTPGAAVAETTTEATGAYSLSVDSTPSGSYKIRVSDPAGTFTTTYLWGKESFDDAYVFGCT